jgi:UDP:flavonoid glycosyltransferase YjiC (YdhE family)
MAASAAPASPPPHALVLPYPAQGHVIPFMELAHRFLDGGFDVTFVNTKYNHDRVMAAAAAAGTTTLAGAGGRLRLIAVADGIDDAGDHENLILLNAAMQEAIPPQLEALLDGEEGLGKVTCVVVDAGMSFVLDVVKRRGITSAALWPASAAVLSVMVNAEKLIRDGVIDDDGKLCHATNRVSIIVLG